MNKEFLYDLLNTPSVSGNEELIAEKVASFARDFADNVTVDAVSNVISSVNDNGSKKILLAAHMDEIGLIVTKIDSDGFLRVKMRGGIYGTTYPGHRVKVITERGPVYGSVLNTRDLEKKGTTMTTDDIIIDIGATSREDAEKVVNLGDMVVFDTETRELLNGRLTARALDDKAGVYVINEALRLIKEKGTKNAVFAVSTVGEETIGTGAYFSGSNVLPDIAIIVDVTYSNDYPGGNTAANPDVKLGAGPVLCDAPHICKKLTSSLKDVAKAAGIPYQIEFEAERTYTDGDNIMKTGAGVPFTLVSIPLRYMHTPAEICSLDDLDNAAKLIAEFVLRT